MLQKDPAHRASLEQIEAHHWLQGLDDALLSPEAPPHWFSGALSPSSPRSGLPECGDLLAARSSAQLSFPQQSSPKLSFALHPPPTEEPPVNKNLLGLQQICEEEEEEEEQEQGLEKNGEANVVQMVISNQPVSQTQEPPSWTGTGTGVVVDCCQGLSLTVGPEGGKEKEPNNNSHGHPVLPLSPPSSVMGTPVGLRDKHSPTGQEGQLNEASQAVRDDLTTTSTPLSQNAVGSRHEATPKTEHGKRHSIKLRERLFQFPLCEKALALNSSTHKKPKMVPLAQYNCCRVL